MREKAYKLLAIQERISNNEAKKLIDDGYVFARGKKIKIARAEIEDDIKFKVNRPKKSKVLYEDKDLIAIDKAFGVDSYDLEKTFKGTLVHRLDKTTSGVILLAKSDEFKSKCLKEFEQGKVYKEYVAVVYGTMVDEMTIKAPILTTKGKVAKSKIDKTGKPAITEISPLEAINKRSKLKVIIKTGRTHQIRVHLESIGHPIVGDTQYGGRDDKRVFLHSRKISIFGKEYEAQEPEDFKIT